MWSGGNWGWGNAGGELCGRNRGRVANFIYEGNLSLGGSGDANF